MKFDKIFQDAKDKNVSRTYVYGNGTDGSAYVDAACTEKVTASALEDLFHKGLVIVVAGAKYLPVSLAVEDGVATVTYVTADSTTATTAVLATLESVADPA